MEWRKNFIIIFSPLLAVLWFTLRNETPVENSRVERKVASLPRAKAPTQVQTARMVAKRHPTLTRSGAPHRMLMDRIPQNVEETFDKDTSIKLTPGYDFLKDVAAVPKGNYRPAMGEIIQENKELIYFRTNPGHQFIPVAISRSTNMLYPISSILHVKGATPSVRQNLLDKGYTQYYYHAPLKLLSIESSSSQVLKDYSELQKKGFKVELEVLKPGHQKI